jgi:hypothetical protein
LKIFCRRKVSRSLPAAVDDEGIDEAIVEVSCFDLEQIGKLAVD